MAIADAARDFVQKNTGSSAAAGSVASAASSFEALIKGDKGAATQIATDYSFKVVETVVAAIPVFGPLVSTALGFLEGIFGSGPPAHIDIHAIEQARIDNPGKCLLAFVRLGFFGEDGLATDRAQNSGYPSRPSLASGSRGFYGLSVRDLVRRYLLVLRPDLLVPGSQPGPAWAHELAYFYTTFPGIDCINGQSYQLANPVELDYDPPVVSGPTTNPSFGNWLTCANMFWEGTLPANNTWSRCGELWGPDLMVRLQDCYKRNNAIYYGQWQKNGPYSIANSVPYLSVMQLCEQERQKAIKIKQDADKLAANQKALIASSVGFHLLDTKKKVLVARSAPKVSSSKPISKPVKGLLIGSTLAVGGIVAWEYRRQLMKLFVR